MSPACQHPKSGSATEVKYSNKIIIIMVICFFTVIAVSCISERNDELSADEPPRSTDTAGTSSSTSSYTPFIEEKIQATSILLKSATSTITPTQVPATTPARTPFVTLTPSPVPITTPEIVQEPQVIATEHCYERIIASGVYDDECQIKVFGASMLDTPLLILEQTGISFESPRFSPDGKWMVYVERVPDRGARLQLLATDWKYRVQLTEWLEIGRRISSLAWSPDSSSLVFKNVVRFGNFEEGPTYLVDVRTKEIVELENEILALEWSYQPMSRVAMMIYDSDLGTAKVILKDASEDGSLETIGSHLFSTDTTIPASIAWHPEGTNLAVCVGLRQAELWVVDLLTFEWFKVDELSERCNLQWSKDGIWLAAREQTAIRFYNSQTWTLSETLVGTLVYAESVGIWSITSATWNESSYVYGVKLVEPNRNVERLEIISTEPDKRGRLSVWNMAFIRESPGDFIRSFDWSYGVSK